MLQFHPDDRITVDEALNHPYLLEFQGQIEEPSCDELFDFDFERSDSAKFSGLKHVCTNVDIINVN